MFFKFLIRSFKNKIKNAEVQKASLSLGITHGEWLKKAGIKELLGLVCAQEDVNAILDAPRGGWAQVAEELSRVNKFAIGKQMFSKPLGQITEELISKHLKDAVDTLLSKVDAPITKAEVATAVETARAQISGDCRIQLADKPRDVTKNKIVYSFFIF